VGEEELDLGGSLTERRINRVWRYPSAGGWSLTVTATATQS
jgi:hypothetical protein